MSWGMGVYCCVTWNTAGDIRIDGTYKQRGIGERWPKRVTTNGHGTSGRSTVTTMSGCRLARLLGMELRTCQHEGRWFSRYI